MTCLEKSKGENLCEPEIAKISPDRTHKPYTQEPGGPSSGFKDPALQKVLLDDRKVSSRFGENVLRMHI